jgi:hypothetical protein
MRKAFGGALCAALIAGLALASTGGGTMARTSAATLDGNDARAAAAQRATTTYKGELKQAGPNTSIKIKAKVRNGQPKAITGVVYRGLPAACEVSPPPQRISGSWTLSGVKVNSRRKFKAVGDSQDGNSSLRFTGRFSTSFKKVRGKFQTTVLFGPDNPPEETCVGQTKPYAAKR